MDHGVVKLNMALMLLREAYKDLEAAKTQCRVEDAGYIEIRMVKLGYEIMALARLSEMERFK
jgi:hypothetical protein